MKTTMGTRLFALLLTFALALSIVPAAMAEGEKTITLAMDSAWDSLVPFDTTSAYSDCVLDMIYDKLVYLKADGTYLPRLANKVEMNEDSTVLTFYLNENAKWHDGEPVTAKDVVFTCKVYASPTLASPRYNNLAPFKGFGESDDSLAVEALDDHTVQFTLQEPTNVDFLLFNKFRDIYMLPEHILGDVPLDQLRNHEYWNAPIGSGPAIYDSQISGERIELKANKDYYLKTPDWDRFVVRAVTSSNMLAGLMNGEIDCLAGSIGSLPISDWDMAQQQENLTCLSAISLHYQYMAINNAKPYLNVTVRRAINKAINRDLIVQGVLQGEGVAAYGPVAPSVKYYCPDIEEPFDPEGAKALLAEAGWDPNTELVMAVPTGNTVREKAAVIVQQNLADIGIKTKIVTADFATHLNNVRAGDYDLGFIGSSGSPDPSECVINFNPDHLNNFGQLTDWTIYNTGAKGERCFDFESRKACYDEYQRLLRSEVPWSWLYYANVLYAYNNRISGIQDVQDFSQQNRDIWNWTIVE